jgi:hypothetical protein
MLNIGKPQIDIILLSRHDDALHPEVEDGLRSQCGVDLVLHRIVGKPLPSDEGRYETIARARNEGRLCGAAPWLMFVDDDVVLDPQCIATLVNELSRRPAFGALAADYLGERQAGTIAPHVSMGATLFRREIIHQIPFRWRENRCECQCCCDDLRRLRWAIDYFAPAKARHLPSGSIEHELASPAGSTQGVQGSPDEPLNIPRVCLVACYLGRPPGWIQYYLQSCAFNPSIDFLIFTDQEDFPAAPRNVRVEPISTAQFNSLATSKVRVQVRLSHSRKLCDFKPAYGHLFEEHLAAYDYWGYTDLDVIYGDLRRRLTEGKLQEFDVFTARSEFLVGHFTLFRNTSEMRMLYQRSRDFRAAFQSPQVLSFDECGKQWWQRFEGKPLSSDATCDSITHVVHRLMADNKISARFEPAVIEWPELPSEGWRLRWDAGKLWIVDQGREAMYFHFHGFKNSSGFQQPRCLEDETAFEITPNGFGPAAPTTVPTASETRNGDASIHNNAKSEPARTSRVVPPRRFSERPAPCVLSMFNRRHFKLFYTRFLASLRASGNDETVVPVAVGLKLSQRARLARAWRVKPVFRRDSGIHMARRRLLEFAEITRALPLQAPVAYWDAGDVIFQAPLESLWDLIEKHPGKLLAAREPSGYPANPVVVQWTENINDPEARRAAQEIVFNCPFINGGFLAGTAGALTQYFETVAPWYDTPKLAGSTDPGDQLALNVYCHSRPEAWQEISDAWNYCLWGRDRNACYRREDGQYVDSQGVAIAVVHGNADTLQSPPILRTRDLAGAF